MSKILLINANVTVEPYPVYPTGMSIAAQALTLHGHEVFQLDLLKEDRSFEKVQEVIASFGPDYIGLSLRNIDNVDYFTSHQEWYLDGYKRLVTIIRKQTSSPIICGGPGFSIMPEEILDYVQADYGIRGEAEIAFPELIDSLNQGYSPPPIKVALPVPPEHQLRPLWEPELVHFYIEQGGIIGIPAKRGCPFQCAYCTYPFIDGNKFRIRQIPDVIQDLLYLKGLGISEVFFTDSVFNDVQGAYLQLARALIDYQVNIRWGAFFTPRHIQPGDLELLKESGLFAIELGTDASSNATLEGMNKGFTWDQVQQFQLEAEKLRIPVAHYVIFGGPNETPETVKEGIDNLQQLTKAVVFAFIGIRIFPHTRIHQQAIAEKVIPPQDDLLRPVYYLSPHISAEWLTEELTKAFKGQRTRIFPPEKGREMTDVMKRFGYKGLLWDQLIKWT